MPASSAPTRSPEPAVASNRPSSRAWLRDLDLDELRALQRAQGYPLISILLRTAPDLLITSSEQARLLALVHTATRRLRLELNAASARAHTRSLVDMVHGLAGERTSEGLVLFAGADTCLAYRLASPVEDRVVVDPTFATRDLARSLSQNPPYRLLMLRSDGARLFMGAANRLFEVHDGGFPIDERPTVIPFDSSGHRLAAERAGKDRQQQVSTVRRAALALSAHGSGADLPLVVMAPPGLAAAARREQRWEPIDVVIGSFEKSSLSRLAHLARPGVETYLAAVRERALSRLDTATRQRRSALGIHRVWAAARRGGIETLVVDESFRYPAWTTLGGQTLVRAVNADLPDVLDDAVDEIIEMVQKADGRVCFVPAGSLGTDRIAAVLARR